MRKKDNGTAKGKRVSNRLIRLEKKLVAYKEKEKEKEN